MADQELLINVKASKDSAADTNLRQIKETFSSLSSPEQANNFEKLARSFKLTDIQVKELMKSINEAHPLASNFAAIIGRGGLLLEGFAAVVAAVKIGSVLINNMASGVMTISDAARRMGGIHPAQLQANVDLMRTVGIDPGRGQAMMESLARKRDELGKTNSELFKSIVDTYSQQGGPWVERMTGWLRELSAAPSVSEMANLIRRRGDEIQEIYASRPERGAAERGAARKREWLELWMGLPDFEKMTKDFVTVSEEAKVAWDKNEETFREFYKITTNIDHNIRDILRSFVTMALEELGINPAMQKFNWLLDQQVRLESLLAPFGGAWSVATLPWKYLAGWAAPKTSPLQLQGPLGGLWNRFFGGGSPSTKTPELQGVPGGPSGTVNNDLSEGAYSSLTGGTGGYNAFVNAAHARGQSPSVVAQRLDASGLPGAWGAAHRSGVDKLRRGEPLNISEQAALQQAGPASFVTGDIGFVKDWKDRVPRSVNVTSPSSGRQAFTKLRNFDVEDYEKANPPGSKLHRDIGLADIDRKGVGAPQRFREAQPGRGARDAHWYENWTSGLEKYRRGEPRTEAEYVALDVHGEMLVGQDMRFREDWQSRVPKSENVEQRGGAMRDVLLHPRGHELYDPSTGIGIPGIIPGVREKRDLFGPEVAEAKKEMDAAREYNKNLELARSATSGLMGSEESGKRARLDRDMANDLNIRGKLNVSVEAPPGTEVNAKGGGMFENSVALDRQIAYEP